jgi:hypothetical protein
MTTNDPVQLFFSGNPPQAKESHSMYKDYVIQQNVDLLRDNKQLSLEKQEYETRIDDLESQLSENETTSIKLKQFMKNFYHQSELYRSIAKADHDYFRSFLQHERDKDLALPLHQYNPCLWAMGVMLICQMYFSLLINLMISCGLLFVCYSITIEHSESHVLHRSKITDLVSFKNSKKKEIDELKRTMDVIGEVIDNAV